MWQTAHHTYMEERILSADPIELVRMLYRAATGSVREARRHLAAGDILARSSAISKACDVIGELAGALDLTRGGEIGIRLAQHYDYMLRRLVEANFRQADEPLAEVLSLLATLAEGWDGLKTEAQTPAGANPWQQPPPQDAVAGAGAQAWSF